jgi:hypothetical protein
MQIDLQVWADREHGDRQIGLQVQAIEGIEAGRWTYRYVQIESI